MPGCEEDALEDAAFRSVGASGCRGNDDALSGHHFAHHTTGTIGRRHKDRADADLLGR